MSGPKKEQKIQPNMENKWRKFKWKSVINYILVVLVGSNEENIKNKSF